MLNLVVMLRFRNLITDSNYSDRTFCSVLLGIILFFLCPSILFAQQNLNTGKPIFRHDSLKSLKTHKKIVLNGSDGPYIINDTLYRTTAKGKLIKQLEFNPDSLQVVVDNDDADQFYVALEKTKPTPPPSTYDMPSTMVVISDIEGKYDAFAGFLYANNIIDQNHDWIFENGHLVLVGDFVDRGKNVTQVLWLIYKLESQALKSGGQVHFILGNHEVLNFYGDHRYNRAKYIKIAQEISGKNDKREALQYLYSNKGVLGEWLATKNIVEKVGTYIFVHAGLSPPILDFDSSIEDINNAFRRSLEKSQQGNNAFANFLYGTTGPFWYRGYFKSNTKYPKIQSAEIDSILNYYKADKIVVGHTLVNKISYAFTPVIGIDVSHGAKKFSGKTKGLLLKDCLQYIVDDKGTTTLLE